MTFREKVKKAFRRNSEKNNNNNKPKIEYYRRGECPRSKYRGPVDPEHRRKLYEWNFAAATADRRRSFDLDLSPCTSVPGRALEESDASMEDDDTVLSESEPHVQIMGLSALAVRRIEKTTLTCCKPGSIRVAHHEDAPSGSFDSDQSTAVMSSCRSSSLTLKDS